MEIQIKLTEHQYKTLNDWCVTNKIDVSEYLGKKVWEAFMVDKYGDLNDKVPKVVDKKEEKEPEGVVMAPYDLQVENAVTITTPKEETHVKEEAKVETTPTPKQKTPKKIPLTPIK